MGRLSTHVLDTAHGKPVAGMAIRLYSCRDEERLLLKSTVTNHDGRTDEALLGDNQLAAGIYELVFSAGEYFRAQHEDLGTPAFLEKVVVRFGVSDTSCNYHVPLLLSPYGYSTYRGS